MKEILTLNDISPVAEKTLGSEYKLTCESASPDAIIVRSYNMHGYSPAESVVCIGRAGAGVNNIPVDECTERGIVVFNTPGANANSVKEMTVLAVLAAAHNAFAAYDWAKTLSDGEKTVAEQVEKGKNAFVGEEIANKTVGIIGLGAIGAKVATALAALGMRVIAYDPYLKDGNALKAAGVILTDDKNRIYKECDYLSLHVPLDAQTRAMINAAALSQMKDGVKIINYARGELVAEGDLIAALKSGKVSAYVTDFPSEKLAAIKGVAATPHLGATTIDAEENCAFIVAERIKDYLENGNISGSVNFPDISSEKYADRLIALFIGEDTQAKITALLPVSDCMIRAEMKLCSGVMHIDSDQPLPKETVEKIAALHGVKKVISL